MRRPRTWTLVAALVVGIGGCKSSGPAAADGAIGQSDADFGPSQIVLPDASDNDATELTEIPQATASGKVSLPAASSIDLSTLEVLTFFDQQKVSSDGSFSLSGSDGARQGAMVVDQDGNALLIGWIKAGEGNALSSTSTAAMLLFFYGGGSFLPPSSWNKTAEVLLAHPATAELAQVIEQEIAAGELPLVSKNQTMLDSVDLTLTKILPSLGKIEQALVLVNPAERKSGVTVLIGDKDGNSNADINQITLMNERRRRTHVFIERKEHSGYVEDNDFELPPTAGLNGVLGTITDVINGTVAWAPVTYGPVGLGIVETEDDKIEYRVRVVGGGMPNSSIELTASQSKKRNFTLIKALLVDVYFPFFFGQVDTAWIEKIFGSPSFKTFVETMVAKTYSGTTQSFLEAMIKGDLQGAVTTLINELANDDTFRTWFLEAIRVQVIKHYGPGATWKLMQKWSEMILGPLAFVDNLLKVADFSAVATDWLSSKDKEQWNVSVLAPKVLLSPAKATLSCGEKGSFKATVKNGGQSIAGDLIYEFSSTAKFGTLTTAANASYENVFETSNPVVYYTISPNKIVNGSSDSIEVKVYLLLKQDKGTDKKELLGKASSTVTLTDSCSTSAGYLATTLYSSGCTVSLSSPGSVTAGEKVTITAQANTGGVCGSAHVYMSYATEATIDGVLASGSSGSAMYDFCYDGTPQPLVPGGVQVALPDSASHSITFTVSEKLACPVCVKYDANGSTCPSNASNAQVISGPAVVMSGTGGTHGWSTVRFFEVKAK